MPKFNHDKTYYRTPPPPANVQKQLCDIANTVNTMSSNYNAEIKGWWIWVDGDPVSSADESILSDMLFSCCKRGRNAGKWYYKHPISPNGRRRGYNRKSSSKPKPISKPKPSREHKTKREMLEDELESLEKMYQVDSGENHININKMIADVKVKREALGTHNPVPLQEDEQKSDAIEKETETANDTEVSENPALTAEQLRDFFKK